MTASHALSHLSYSPARKNRFLIVEIPSTVNIKLKIFVGVRQGKRAADAPGLSQAGRRGGIVPFSLFVVTARICGL